MDLVFSKEKIFNAKKREVSFYRPFLYCIDYGQSERVGPFTRICRPDWTENEARNGKCFM